MNRDIVFNTKPNHSVELKVSKNFNSSFNTAGDQHGSIVWNPTLKQLIYTPEENFVGEINVTLNQDNDVYNISGLVANTFKPRARIIKIIGQELISNDVIALVELIKNSYDADAFEIDVILNDILSDNGEILVKDNGCGMSYEKIVNVWLEPATPDKKSNSERTYSSCYLRRLLGEKGIGRFAVHRLGDKIELITRARTDCNNTLLDYETRVEIDWTDFTEDKYLDDIPVRIERVNNPQVFIDRPGTLIRITNIHPWKNIKAVKDAVLKIRGLESPVKPKKNQQHRDDNNNDPGIKINISSNDSNLNKEIKEIKTLAEVLKTGFYKFSAIIDEKGEILYEYEFDRIDYQDLKRPKEKIEPIIDDLKNYNTDWFEEHPLNNFNSPGTFEVNFFAWDLDTAALKVAGLADYYKNLIKPNSGIRIYRDNFRVWPYGESNDDWLELDIARLNAPKERSVSRNQVFGVVHISSIENNQLKDQSNREGLIINEQYEHFYQLVSGALTVFARERKKDKINIDKVSKSKSLQDTVTENINSLKNSIEKNNHNALYSANVEKIETSYREKINDVLERYMMAAAIGISYSLPIHEMKLRLSSIKHIVEDISKNPILQDQYLRQLIDYIKDTEDIVSAVTSIMSRQKKQEINLMKVANNVKILKESDLNKYGVKYEIIGDKNIIVEAVPGLLNTAVLNLVDNAVYWLRVKKNQLREQAQLFEPKITIELSRNSENKAVLKVCDNGNGFEDPFDLLTEPYYSRKTDGLGLGLYLVNEIIIRFGGHLDGYNNNGATVELIF